MSKPKAPATGSGAKGVKKPTPAARPAAASDRKPAAKSASKPSPKR